MRALLLFIITLSVQAFALEIPRQLNNQDRREVVRILGMNTSAKMLSNPYPLGGYNGLEIGLALEMINTRQLNHLGCVPGSLGCTNTERSNETEFRYPRISIGKGLYYNVDVFLHFMPPTSNKRIADFGGTLRWTFYQAKFAPINLSLLMHGTHFNVGDAFVNQSLGSELIAGINVNDFALYFGGGPVYSKGRFIAGTGPEALVDPTDPDVNGQTNTVAETLTETHTILGVSLHFQDLFTALQIDRYHDPVYGAKIGMRF